MFVQTHFVLLLLIGYSGRWIPDIAIVRIDAKKPESPSRRRRPVDQFPGDDRQRGRTKMPTVINEVETILNPNCYPNCYPVMVA